MNIYLITVETHKISEYYHSHIIAANTPQEVVEIAKKICASEGEYAWKEDKVELLGIFHNTTDKPHILLSSYNAG